MVAFLPYIVNTAYSILLIVDLNKVLKSLDRRTKETEPQDNGSDSPRQKSQTQFLLENKRLIYLSFCAILFLRLATLIAIVFARSPFKLPKLADSLISVIWIYVYILILNLVLKLKLVLKEDFLTTKKLYLGFVMLLVGGTIICCIVYKSKGFNWYLLFSIIVALSYGILALLLIANSISLVSSIDFSSFGFKNTKDKFFVFVIVSVMFSITRCGIALYEGFQGFINAFNLFNILWYLNKLFRVHQHPHLPGCSQKQGRGG